MEGTYHWKLKKLRPHSTSIGSTIGWGWKSAEVLGFGKDMWRQWKLTLRSSPSAVAEDTVRPGRSLPFGSVEWHC